jgi:hypothetical protein
VALDEIELYAEVLSAVAASDRPEAKHGVELGRGQRPVGGRHGTEHLRVQLDLVEGHPVMDAEIEIFTHRATSVTEQIRRNLAPGYGGARRCA